jgi:hypothetical protein
MRESCENVEPIVTRDEATEHYASVTLEHC